MHKIFMQVETRSPWPQERPEPLEFLSLSLVSLGAARVLLFSFQSLSVIHHFSPIRETLMRTEFLEKFIQVMRKEKRKQKSVE